MATKDRSYVFGQRTSRVSESFDRFRLKYH
jgi:hypothetical protein